MSSDLQTLPPFRPEVLRRQIASSVAVQRVLIALVLIGWVLGMVPRFIDTHWPDGFLFAGLVGWFIANYASSRTTRLSLESMQLSSVEAPASQVEHVLAQALPRFTLYRNIRYMLYHQLAVLRHRQHRYNESAWLATTLLEYLPAASGTERGALYLWGRIQFNPPHRHAPLRIKLLILLADAALFQQQLPTVYLTLCELQTHRLDLMQTMQLLEIQTRYQMAIGQSRLALARLAQKLQMVDLMPLPHAVQMHQLLALAAESDARPHTAAYLRRRGELLTPTID